jgi:hypothetical protein
MAFTGFDSETLVSQLTVTTGCKNEDVQIQVRIRSPKFDHDGEDDVGGRCSGEPRQQEPNARKPPDLA